MVVGLLDTPPDCLYPRSGAEGKAGDMGRRTWWRIVAGLGAALLGVTGLTGLLAAPSAAANTTDTVTVNATPGLGTIPSNAIGLNTAVYDGHMNDAAIPGLVKAAGIDALRYPGGSYADIYNWQTNVAQGGFDAPNTSFADFMKTATATGANPIITVNYGTGTPALAAAWVSSCTTIRAARPRREC
jgi:hypothetical protein